MSTAPARMKPASIGSDSRYDTAPARANPIPTRMMPTTRARAAARPIHSDEPCVAVPASAPAVSRAVNAVGPAWRYGDDDHRAATKVATQAAYKPEMAGIP